jgi:ADP-heptose:LPS heptosyltransferase
MHNILFVELLGGIGDVLIALPAIQALARSYPQSKLTVLTFTPGGELLECDPLIEQVIYIKRSELKQHPFGAKETVEKLLAHNQFDLIVSDSNYDSIERVIQESDTPRVVTNLWRKPPANERVGDRFVQILLAEELIQAETIAPPQLHLTPTEQHHAQQSLDHVRRPLVILYPDAGMAIKRWPTANFISLGRELQQRYGATIIVPIGSDQEQAEQIASGIGSTAQVWPRGTLRELASLMASANLVVASDTGSVRIAAALGTPTITLFGPSWHERYGQPSPHVNLQGYSECTERVIENFTEQSCWYSGVCPLGHWQTCLEAITPTEVMTAATSLLDVQGFGTGDGGNLTDISQQTSPLSSPSKIESPLKKASKIDPPLKKEGNPKPKIDNQWAKVRNILVMRLDNIGDVIMTSPALRTIKENLPHSRITLMASPGGAQVAQLLPWVDEVLPWRVLWQDLGRLDFDPMREWDLIQTVRDRKFDAAIIFTSFSQTPHPAGYLCYLAGIPLRLGESKEWGGGVLSTEVKSAPDEIHQVERNLQLIAAVGFQVSDRSLSIQIPETIRQSATGKLREQGLSADTPYLLLNPWTSCQSRNYSWERFAVATRQLAEITGWPIVVTGVEKDRDRTIPLLEALEPHAIDLIGATSLPELAALIAGARLVLTNNTSTMHIADAARTPNVVLFAGTEYESQWQPRHSPSRLLRQPTPCSPCYAFTCPYNLECLDIAPEKVVAAGLELLQINLQLSGASRQFKMTNSKFKNSLLHFE